MQRLINIADMKSLILGFLLVLGKYMLYNTRD